MYTPKHALERVARDAALERPDSIQALAHSVITYPHVYNFPAELTALLESELSSSEIKYRRGLGPGVEEGQVVKFLNELAARFHLPAYTKTTPIQVRNLRMRLAINSPYFMGAGITTHPLKKGEPVNTEMSPLQAMHLVNVMIDQKILNDLYQDPAIDIVQAEKERHEAYMREAAATGKKAIMVSRSNTRSLEVRNTISQGIQSMSISDALGLVDGALKTFRLK
jgi:hypothetical protein